MADSHYRHLPIIGVGAEVITPCLGHSSLGNLA